MEQVNSSLLAEATRELAQAAGLEDVKPQVKLPGNNRLVSDFAQEIADIIKNKNCLFYRSDSKEVVEVAEIKINKSNSFEGFRSINPHRFISLAENFISPGYLTFDFKTNSFKWIYKSMTSANAQAVLQSPMLQDSLPKIERIFTVPIPLIYDGKLTFPKKGYDCRFNSWLLHDAPEIEESMELKYSKEIIDYIYSEFCFQTPQDKTNAIAGLVTPFLRGIYNKFSTRTPVVFYKANRERSGKDYCAGIPGIVYEGYPLEEPPISNSETYSGNDSAELRKKITAAFLLGRKRLHFSNNKGHIDNAVFESVTTAERYSDRILGRNDIVSFPNEIDFSLSGNLGVSCTPDFANRCLFVNLFLAVEDANSRKFKNPNLHEWIKSNRSKILSSLYCLVRNWFEKGMPSGTVPFTSYPEWARVCGGVMESTGYDSPTAPDSKTAGVTGDYETQDMKVLFELCFAESVNYSDTRWFTRKDIQNIIKDEEIFSSLKFGDRADDTRFGIRLAKFIGRELSGIKMEVDDLNIRAARRRYRFVKLQEQS